MKRFVSIILVVFLFSCKEDKIKETPVSRTQLFISTDWYLDHTERCDEYLLSPMEEQKYSFNSDQTFTYYYGTFIWKDIGSWSLDNEQSEITLEYRTINYDTSDVKTKTITIHDLTESDFVKKEIYNDTTLSAQFCEFEFIYYTAKTK